MIIVLYITAVVIFVFFRNEYLSFEEENNTMWVSVVLAFNYGIRATEGLGQYMFDTTGIRLLVDTTIYFVLVVILRNIFFGIIINTFGELRNIKKEREEHASNRCFICGVDRHEYDKIKHKDNVDFKSHRKKTHNMWNYLYFVVKIWYQPRNQDTSLEKYVRMCMEKDDTCWFPVGVIGYNDDGSEMRVAAVGDGTDNKQTSAMFVNNEEQQKEANHLEVFTKISEKLSIMERQSSIVGELSPSQQKMSFLSKSSPTSTQMMSSTSLERKKTIKDKDSKKQLTETAEFVERTVRNGTSSLQDSLLLLKKSINRCSGKLDDMESSAKKPQRLGGIRMSSSHERSLAPVGRVESPSSDGGDNGSRKSKGVDNGRRGGVPGPSLSFLSMTTEK